MPLKLRTKERCWISDYVIFKTVRLYICLLIKLIYSLTQRAKFWFKFKVSDACETLMKRRGDMTWKLLRGISGSDMSMTYSIPIL